MIAVMRSSKLLWPFHVHAGVAVWKIDLLRAGDAMLGGGIPVTPNVNSNVLRPKLAVDESQNLSEFML